MRHHLHHLLALGAALGAAGCLPYTVGSTARTVAPGHSEAAMTYYYIPNAFKLMHDSVGLPMAGVDREWRFGLDARSDVGLRLTSGAGLVGTYKARVRDYGAGGPAIAYMVGTGVVNAGEHAHFEGTLIASGDEDADVVPYGGVRAMQVVPISSGAAHDSPTIGAFGGVQLGRGGFAIRPELGVFYDRSALGMRSSSVLFVPAVTMRRQGTADAALRAPMPRLGGAHGPDGERPRARPRRCRLRWCGTTR